MVEVLNAEQRDIEGPGAVEWVGAMNATVARSAAFAHSGTSSLAVTAVAAAQADVTLSVRSSAFAGQNWIASVWIRHAVNHFPAVRLRFVNAGGATIQDYTVNPTPNTTGWFSASVAGIAPVGTATVTIRVQFFSNAAGAISYIDDASLDDGSGGVVLSQTVSRILSTHTG